MDDLLQQAEELGIKVDKRWSEKRLQQEIDTALGAPAQEAEEVAEKSFPVKLNKNYRPVGEFKVSTDDGLRDPSAEETMKTPAGLVIHLPIDEARAVISKKIADRDDPIA